MMSVIPLGPAKKFAQAAGLKVHPAPQKSLKGWNVGQWSRIIAFRLKFFR